MSFPLDPLVPPPDVVELASRVRATGAAVFTVGGAIRDAWLGLEVDDWDLATAAPPAEVARALGVDDLSPRDARLGRVAVTTASGQQVVFTTFREEGDYGVDRRPGWVRFTDDLGRDARRRDFTVNAIYVECGGSRVVDPVGGVEDLRRGRLRVIGEARARLAEDPLRVLRAVRLEASRGLALTPVTVAAMAELACSCARLRPERRFDEIDRTLLGARAGGAVVRMLDTGVLGQAVPELADQGRRLRLRTVPILDCAPARSDVRWAALLGEPDRAEAALRALHAPRGLRCEVQSRLLRPPADARLSQVSGQQVIALGVAPGPAVGRILRAVRTRVESGDARRPGDLEQILRDEVRRAIKPDTRGDR